MTERQNKALLVEDNADAAIAGIAVLETLGYIVDLAGDAETAWNEFARSPYELVFSDINLPGMDGIQLATKIRATRPKTRIILATGCYPVAEPTAREFIVLQKPYSLSDLKNAVRALTAGNN